MKRFLRIVLYFVTAVLLTFCAVPTVETAKEDVPEQRCLTIENRTAYTVRMAVGQINNDFFFAETFKPMEIKEACGEIPLGTYIFCWQGVGQLLSDLDCSFFSIDEDAEWTLYDTEVDLWVITQNQVGA